MGQGVRLAPFHHHYWCRGRGFYRDGRPDSDDRLLRHANLVAKRDIVQFVELRKFVTGSFWSKELLAKNILAEIPAQLSSWMKMKGFKPKPNLLNQGNLST